MSWKHFHRAEFGCRGTDCCAHSNLIDDGLLDVLDALREAVGFPLTVTSGYRCPAHNVKVSSTGIDGPHTTGRAADLGVDRERAVLVLEKALALPFTGIGINQKGAGRFIHLDTVPRAGRAIWSY